MAKLVPETQTMKVSDARREFNQLLNRVFKRETRVLIEKSGIPVAALVSIEDLKRLEQLNERDRDFSILHEISEAFRDVPPEDIERQVSRAIAEVRQEQDESRVAKRA